MPITDIKLRTIKPRTKPFKLFDGHGLYMIVMPHGGKWWRFNYKMNGKQKTLSVGTYPLVGLKKARELRDELRLQLVSRRDPSVCRKVEKIAKTDTFEALAREWLSQRKTIWSAGHGHNVIHGLEKDVFPWIGSRHIDQIKAQDLLEVLRRIEDRGAKETAHRVLAICTQVFNYAGATGRTEKDPCRFLRGALAPAETTHLAAITEPKEVGALLRAIECYRGSFVTRCALLLAPLVFVRPGELRHAEWTEIDFEAKEWRIPAEKMKTGLPHIVPLAEQALAILRDIYPLTGRWQYVFPGGHNIRRPMSENAVIAALRRMGYSHEEMTFHGFRAMARTILDEVLGFRPDYIEHQLAHAVRDPLGRAYNRTKHLPERRVMMQAWADYLDRLRDGEGNVTQITSALTGPTRPPTRSGAYRYYTIRGAAK